MKLKLLRPAIHTLVPTLKTLPRARRGTPRLRGQAAVDRRARWLQRHPLCVECESAGVTNAGFEVDHILALADGGADNESNFQTLCQAHHAAKTAREASARAGR